MGKEVPEVAGLSPQHFQKQLAELIAESRAFAVGEDLDSISILLSDWLPSIRSLLAQALAVLSDLEKLSELSTDQRAEVRLGWSRQTGTLIAPKAFEELADVCFIAAAECRACLQQIEPLSSDSESFTLLVVMERAQSRLSGSLCAVEARLAQMSGRASQTRHVDLGRKSLQARHLIARFQRRVMSVAQQPGDGVESRIRAVGNSFAWLIGHDHFASLRASDRLTARTLHRRTLLWLRGERSEEEGTRLWHDVTAFIELLQLINRRPEIVQHDFKIVLEVASVLADSDPHSPMPRSVVEPLNSILGRDERLDELLEAGVDNARLLTRLLQVYDLLEREGGASGDPAPEPPPGSREGAEPHGSARASVQPPHLGSPPGASQSSLAVAGPGGARAVA